MSNCSGTTLHPPRNDELVCSDGTLEEHYQAVLETFQKMKRGNYKETDEFCSVVKDFSSCAHTLARSPCDKHANEAVKDLLASIAFCRKHLEQRVDKYNGKNAAKKIRQHIERVRNELQPRTEASLENGHLHYLDPSGGLQKSTIKISSPGRRSAVSPFQHVPSAWTDRHGYLVGATFEGFIGFVTSPVGSSDPEAVNIFLLCFRYMQTPLQAFKALVWRYENSSDTEIKAIVANLLQLWVELHWRHGHDKQVYEPLRQFASKSLPQDSLHIEAAKITYSLGEIASTQDDNYHGHRLTRMVEHNRQCHQLHPPSPTDFQLDRKTKRALLAGRFEDINVLALWGLKGAEEFARQLTLLAATLYASYRPDDAVDFWRVAPEKRTGGETMRSLVVFENALSLWATSSVILQQSASECVKACEFLLDVIAACLRHRNFGSSCAIFTGLQRRCVERIVTERNAVSANHQINYQNFKRFFDMYDHAEYHYALRESPGMPAIPMMSIFIGDVIKIFSRPVAIKVNNTSPELISVNRYRDLTKIVQAMEMCRSPYAFERIELIQKYLEYVSAKFNMNDTEEEALLARLGYRSKELTALNSPYRGQAPPSPIRTSSLRNVITSANAQFKAVLS
ncbi:ras GEF [Coniophora puteana RWD-64-598 SS2]|uniref:Ras GEF n=1 Tax=Coniophora puteana (strain RWD-64-598) TaxID=741705 RepID=A0A5M3MPS6_CONPW|nr:ras GEF [Coniophora puteana RWD-64-598 SS2]EIW81057.1 ras GEF [Coniophora puteana RWD-64-598 SS2]